MKFVFLQEDEIDWIGLSVQEALEKAADIKELNIEAPRPQKEIMKEKLLEMLQGRALENLIQSISPAQGLKLCSRVPDSLLMDRPKIHIQTC